MDIKVAIYHHVQPFPEITFSAFPYRRRKLNEGSWPDLSLTAISALAIGVATRTFWGKKHFLSYCHLLITPHFKHKHGWRLSVPTKLYLSVFTCPTRWVLISRWSPARCSWPDNLAFSSPMLATLACPTQWVLCPRRASEKASQPDNLPLLPWLARLTCSTQWVLASRIASELVCHLPNSLSDRRRISFPKYFYLPSR